MDSRDVPMPPMLRDGDDFFMPRRRKPKRSGWPMFAAVCSFAAIAVALAVIGSNQVNILGEANHFERDAVRAWLKENTNDGWFEEVKWGPVKAGPPRSALENCLMIRLKYRSHNFVGAIVLDERVFEINSANQASRLNRDYELMYGE